MMECKYCQSTEVERHSDVESIHYKEHTLSVSMAYSICHGCDREFVSKPQILQNDAHARDARKKHDGLMTSTEVRAARIKLSLTQEQAAMVFGGGKNAFSKYERAEVSQSTAMDTLIRLCLKHPHIYRELLINRGVKQAIELTAYEDNVIPYLPRPSANQKDYHSVKKIAVVNERAYG